jgi:RNA polymerase sigma factor (TIGR02999 family)
MTRLINRLGEPDREADEELLSVLYGELHALAAHHLRLHPQQSLQPTALVSEAWLRISRQAGLRVDARAQFFALASRLMRSVLVDRARAHAAQKRGGGRQRIILWDGVGTVPGPNIDLLSLDEALVRLERVDPDLARLVNLRFFGGLEHSEIAGVLSVSLRSVERRWRLARAWLRRELRE